MMKTRIYTLLAALLLTAASTYAQTKIATTISVAVDDIIAGDDARVEVSLTDANNNGVTGIATIIVTQEGVSAKPYNVAVVDGEGTFYVTNLGSASYDITASYAGDDVYAASQTKAPVDLYVPMIPTSLDISFVDNKSSIYVGETATVSITLDKSMNAVVTGRRENHGEEFIGEPKLRNPFVALVNGKGTLELSGFDAGVYDIRVDYAGNDEIKGCTSSVLTLTVSKQETTISVNDITAIKAGEDAIVNVTATPSSVPSCTVTVDGTDYTVALVNGAGSCIIPNLAEGDYEVTASIAGNDKYLGSTDTKQVTVSEGTDPAIERNAVATVTVTPKDYTGNVTVTIDGENYNVVIINGTGKVVLPQLAAGTYAISASIAEDAKYEESTTAAEIVAVPGITFPFAANQTWATWCDDWAWKKPTGVTAYTISAVSGNTVTIAEFTGNEIPSHTPLLLKKTGDAVTPTKVITGTGTDKGYNATTGLASSEGSGLTFYGNASDAKITEGYNYAYGSSYGLYNGEFVLIDTDNGIAANRCLLNVGGTNSAPVLTIGTETTSLSPVPSPSREGSSQGWYTLDGRKLNGKPTQKGIYVNGGRKVVIK